MRKQVRFSLPQLKKYPKRWCIVYYFGNEIKPRVIRVQNIRNKFGASQAEEIINKQFIIPIAEKLLQGIDPNFEVQKTEVKTISNLCNDYTKRLDKEKIAGAISSDTYHDYIRVTHCFERFYIDKGMSDLSLNEYAQNKKYAIEYMLEFKLKREAISANNHLMRIRRLFNFAVENGYITQNPFSGIKEFRVVKKESKRPLSDEEMTLMSEHLRQNDKDFFAFSQFVFACLLRPVEIFRLQIKDIDFENKYIRISGDKTKNKNNRNIVLPNSLVSNLYSFFENLRQYPSEYYVFGSNFVPSCKPSDRAARASERWRKHCNFLGLPKDCQLYGLRHTAITKMLRTLDPNTVRMHADHHSLSMTAHYGNHLTDEMQRDLRERIEVFG